ncbi:MAG: glycosyltransferase [Ignavibacteriaceae bacterium]|jgi:glycosyltransferase involved in cell wall biosynthesis|nr:glycosyltransferase [Ignavibacteriaceae bacterium]
MKIIVFDVPASESGALSVLLDFYKFTESCNENDLEWVFIVSTNALGNPKNPKKIKIERFPSVKRSWLIRLLFELFIAPNIILKHKPDVIFSLQNTAIMRTTVPQVVYVHQSIPYSKTRFSYFKPYERRLALIGDLFRPIIGWSIRKSRVTIVQTRWLKESIEKTHKILPCKIHVVPQEINICLIKDDSFVVSQKFFYPAAPFPYKCFEEIINATAILIEEGYKPIVILTIDGSENAYAASIVRLIHKKALEQYFTLTGRISRSEVISLYCESTLLFTSRLESFGLPLLEARIIGAPIIATRQPFTLEILDGYDRVTLVSQGNVNLLATAMKLVCDEQLKKPYQQSNSTKNEFNQVVEYHSENGWETILKLLMIGQ